MTDEVIPCNCGATCDYAWDTDHPCWGEVCAEDEIDVDIGEYTWLHACEGHYGMSNGEAYKPKPVSNT